MTKGEIAPGWLTEVLYPVVSLDNHVHYVHRALAMPSDFIGRSNGSSEIRDKLAISTRGLSLVEEITRGARGSLVISQGSANVILKFPYLGSYKWYATRFVTIEMDVCGGLWCNRD